MAKKNFGELMGIQKIWLPHSFIWYKRLQKKNNPGVEGSAMKSQAHLSSIGMRASMNAHVCDAVVMTNVPNKSHHRTRQNMNEDFVSSLQGIIHVCILFPSSQRVSLNVITLRNINKAWIGTYTIILEQTVSQYRTTDKMMVGHVSWLRKSNSYLPTTSYAKYDFSIQN